MISLIITGQDNFYLDVLDFFDKNRNKGDILLESKITEFIEKHGYILYADIKYNSLLVYCHEQYKDKLLETIPKNNNFSYRLDENVELPKKNFSKFFYFDTEEKIFPLLVDKKNLDKISFTNPKKYTPKDNINYCRKLIIFGDSYADDRRRYYIYDIDKSHPIDGVNKSWTEILRDELNPKEYYNYGKSGTGPSYSMDIFEKIKSDITNDDILLFLLSNPFRINFNNDISGTYNIRYDEQNQSAYIDDNNSHELKEYFLSNKEHIERYYRENLITIKNANYQYTEQLKQYSLNNNVKTIVFYCFDKVKNYYNEKTFSMFDKTLCEISDGEIENYTENNLAKKDLRLNHMSNENHKIFSQKIINILDDKKDNLQFETKIKKRSDVFKLDNKKQNLITSKDNFIYQ